MEKVRNIALVFGDQLDHRSAVFAGFDPALDVLAMHEVREEASNIPQHKLRLAFFFSAMRHFRDEQRALGRRVRYVELDDPANRGSFAGEIQRLWADLAPERIIVVEPGDWRVEQMLRSLNLPIEIRRDRHFLLSRSEFEDMAEEHPRMILETFYRLMRRRLGILIEEDGTPTGGAWNFDKQNRASLDRQRAGMIPEPKRFPADRITREVVTMVEREFPDAPGRIRDFDLPVTRDQALKALDDFVAHRLARFGRYQDAMLGGEALLYHSHLSGTLNLHLLRPKEVVAKVLKNPAEAPLNSVEGFVRQVIGWREFVRGIYWRLMPEYAERNALGGELPMPAFYWTGETDMRCMREAIGHTIDHAYAHHIERLMVLGLYALLLGVKPYDFHRWHMSMFWDAIDWVSLPNAVGMSQHADGGVMGTKPYAATGKYIDRMSDHCGNCRYDPAKATGDDACPFTTLYWDFLARHRPRLERNPRMKLQVKNLDRRTDLAQIRKRAAALKAAST